MISFEKDGIEYRFFNHLYAVSRCGKVLRKLQPYTPAKHPMGYLMLSKTLMHRAVATCWCNRPDGANDVHHINEIKSDNRAENLEWVTRKQHMGERHDFAGRYERTPESRKKIQQARLGSVTTEATKAKQRAALIGKKRPYFTRAPHSEESRLARRKDHHANLSCCVLGVEYRSFAEAARATGIHRFTIRKRCLSKNFPDYDLV